MEEKYSTPNSSATDLSLAKKHTATCGGLAGACHWLALTTWYKLTATAAPSRHIATAGVASRNRAVKGVGFRRMAGMRGYCGELLRKLFSCGLRQVISTDGARDISWKPQVRPERAGRRDLTCRPHPSQHAQIPSTDDEMCRWKELQIRQEAPTLAGLTAPAFQALHGTIASRKRKYHGSMVP